MAIKRAGMALVTLSAAASCALAVVTPASSAEDSQRYVIAHGKDITVLTAPGEQRVEDLLDAAGYGEAGCFYSLVEEEDFTAIQLYDPIRFAVAVDGRTLEAQTLDGTVGSELERLGIELGEEDTVTPSPESPVTPGMTVTVSRVTYAEEETEEAIPHGTVYEDTDKLDLGRTETKIQGYDGLRRRLYRVRYVDGVEDSREQLSEYVIREPQDDLVLRGTKVKEEPKRLTVPDVTGSADKTSSSDKSGAKTGGSSKSGIINSKVTVGDGVLTVSTGKTYAYTDVLDMKATAYSYSAGSLTSSGAPVQVGIVAALPSTLPRGTRVYVVSNDGKYTYGPATVGDTPGGDIIDLFFETEDECWTFGVRQVKVYILE